MANTKNELNPWIKSTLVIALEVNAEFVAGMRKVLLCIVSPIIKYIR
ncbi:MAG: hypothetical protein ACTXOO_00840 [Sodalis sp. (in: enterobacteria)]